MQVIDGLPADVYLVYIIMFKSEACFITYLHKPFVHEETQRVQSPLVQSIGT